MDVGLFEFDLPPDRIAQHPTPDREDARLLVLDRQSGRILAHTVVRALPEFLVAGDILVLNDTRVFPARLLGHRDETGGAVEWLLTRKLDEDRWEALVHPGQKLHPGARVTFARGSHVLHGEVLAQHFHGRRTVRLSVEAGGNLDRAIDEIGHVPLPPYIHRPDEESDRERYQTVYARARGSVAAPTAGLHLTDRLLSAMAAKGVRRAQITLHVGYGTFKPVRAEQVEEHRVDPEWFEIGEQAAAAINAAIVESRRVIAVGTTTTRALESAAQAGTDDEAEASPGPTGGRTRIPVTAGLTETFIYPGYGFRVLDGLLTNFHLPRSSLLMLVCAFAGREAVLAAYREAVALGYRFYSYGDAMLII